MAVTWVTTSVIEDVVKPNRITEVFISTIGITKIKIAIERIINRGVYLQCIEYC